MFRGLRPLFSALSVDPDRLKVVLMQMVRLVRGGEIVKLSKRSGKAITLVTLLDEVPIDAARFFFNLREPNTHCEFDLDLAVEQSSENPCLLCSVCSRKDLQYSQKPCGRGHFSGDFESCDFGLLTASEETELIRHLAALTGEIIDAAVALDPSKSQDTPWSLPRCSINFIFLPRALRR